MGTTGDEKQADAHREAMERLCREYGEALKTYDMAKAAGDSALAAQLELVVAEKSNVMQAYMERSRDGTGAALHQKRKLKRQGDGHTSPIHPVVSAYAASPATVSS